MTLPLPRTFAVVAGLCAGVSALLVPLVSTPTHAGEVIYIDSYHPEYPWSRSVVHGVQSTLRGTGNSLVVHYMDSLRKDTEADKQRAAAVAYDLILRNKPDVVIACDDDAVQYLVARYLNRTEQPVVFCGTNWDASSYQLDPANVTGMIEVGAENELVDMLLTAVRGNRVGYISSDTSSERKSFSRLQAVYGRSVTFSEVRFARTFDEFKEMYVELNDKVDVLIFNNYVGIDGWDGASAANFIHTTSRIPTGSSQAFMLDFTMLVFAKMAEEQGIWAASRALEILRGTPVSNIRTSHNTRGQIMVNGRLSQSAGVRIPADLVAIATSVIE